MLVPSYLSSRKCGQHIALFNPVSMGLAYVVPPLAKRILGRATISREALVAALGEIGVASGDPEKMADSLAEAGVFEDQDQPVARRLSPQHIGDMYLILTTSCNLRCTYCTIAHNTRCAETMSEEVISRSCDLLLEVQADRGKSLTLYGGEPLLNLGGVVRTLACLEERSGTARIRKTLITNGTLIDADVASLMSHHRVYTIVSLDGPPDANDRHRIDAIGAGSSHQTLAGIEHLRKAGARYGVSLVVGQHNLRALCDAIEFFANDLEALAVGISLPHLEPAFCSDPDWDLGLVESLIQCLECAVRQGLWIEQLMKRLLSLAARTPRWLGCPAPDGACMLRILPDGTASLCENFGLRGKYVVGNVAQGLTTSKVLADPTVATWHQRSPLDRPSCTSCLARSICGAGCPYDAFLETGTIDSPESRSCRINKRLVEWFVDSVYAGLPEDGPVLVPSMERRRAAIPPLPERWA